MDRKINIHIHACVWMDAYVDNRWVGGWVGGWIDGWMDDGNTSIKAKQILMMGQSYRSSPRPVRLYQGHKVSDKETEPQIHKDNVRAWPLS